MSLIRNFFALFTVLLVAGCVSVLPDAPKPKTKFELNPTLEKSSIVPVKRSVIVEEIQAPILLNSRAIIVERGEDPRYLTYAQDQEWEDRLPEMLQDHLIKALEKVGQIKGVAKPEQGLIPNFILISDLSDFQIVYGNKNPAIKIDWKVKVLKLPERQIIATKEFQVLETVSQDSFSVILKTFNRLSGKILHDISIWVRHYIK